MSNPTFDELQVQVDGLLNSAWRGLRDSAGPEVFGRVAGRVEAFRELGLISVLEADGWMSRLGRCPGHDDEGGRDWCAYGCKVRRTKDT